MKGFKTKFIHSTHLPLVVEPTNSSISLPESLDLIKNHIPFFKESILKYGGLLFRNFPIEHARDFVALLGSMEFRTFCTYIFGDSPRTKVLDYVYTSTEAPPSIKLHLHHELSYVRNFPSYIHFYCEVAPDHKGETILGDARKIYQAIDRGIRERFEKHGLKYISRYPYKSALMNFINKSHKSWVHVFDTENKEEVERICLQNGISYQWNRNDWIQITHTTPSIITHPETREKVWFNQAHHYDFTPKFLGWFYYWGAKLLYLRKSTLLHEVYFGNGDKIPRSDLYAVMDVLDKYTIRFPWKKRDVLILDNILIMHGRETFKGPRRILTAMTN